MLFSNIVTMLPEGAIRDGSLQAHIQNNINSKKSLVVDIGLFLLRHIFPGQMSCIPLINFLKTITRK